MCKGKGLINITISELIPIPLGISHRDKIVIEGRGNEDIKKG